MNMSVRNKRIDDLVTRKEAEKIRWDHVLKLCDPPQVPSELLIESVRQRTVFSVCELVADPSSSVTHTHTHTHAHKRRRTDFVLVRKHLNLANACDAAELEDNHLENGFKEMTKPSKECE